MPERETPSAAGKAGPTDVLPTAQSRVRLRLACSISRNRTHTGSPACEGSPQAWMRQMSRVRKLVRSAQIWSTLRGAAGVAAGMARTSWGGGVAMASLRGATGVATGGGFVGAAFWRVGAGLGCGGRAGAGGAATGSTTGAGAGLRAVPTACAGGNGVSAGVGTGSGAGATCTAGGAGVGMVGEGVSDATGTASNHPKARPASTRVASVSAPSTTATRPRRQPLRRWCAA